MDSLREEIAGIGRAELIESLRCIKCSFKIDFTDEYLNSVSMERLRHIVLAIKLRARESKQDA